MVSLFSVRDKATAARCSGGRLAMPPPQYLFFFPKGDLIIKYCIAKLSQAFVLRLWCASIDLIECVLTGAIARLLLH